MSDGEVPAFFRRADLVVLPYREIDQSGVLFTALAFGKPLLLSDVGGFPEVAATGAAEPVVRRASPPRCTMRAHAPCWPTPAGASALAPARARRRRTTYAWDAVADTHDRLVPGSPVGHNPRP